MIYQNGTELAANECGKHAVNSNSTQNA